MRSILGSQDGLLDSQSFEEARTRLPASTAYIEVEGANHACFGDYGAQSGDGEPMISREEARAAIISASSNLIERVRPAGSKPCDSGPPSAAARSSAPKR